MIINTSILLAIAILIGVCAAFLFIKKTGFPIKESWKIWTVVLFAAGAIFYGTIETLATKIIVLEGDAEWNYTHKSVLVFGSPDIELSNGDSYQTKGLDLKLGKTYCFNYTNIAMLFYPTVYTPTEGIFLFDTSKDKKIPDSFYIPSGYYIDIKVEPEFWFRNAPKTVEVSRGFFEQLWTSIFNIGDVRWAVVPYVIEEE